MLHHIGPAARLIAPCRSFRYRRTVARQEAWPRIVIDDSPARRNCSWLTGRLASLNQSEAQSLVAELGGRIVPTITKQTTMLVVGMAGWPLSEDGGVSRKLDQAARVNGRGGRVRVVSEAAFLKQFGRSNTTEFASKSYPADTICKITKLDNQTLTRLEALGLIEPHDGTFDYQDVVSLQTIARLLNDGVRPERISGSLHSLRSILPGVDRPLAQLRIIAENPKSLLLDLDGGLRTVAGQLAFDFDAGRHDSEECATIPCQPVDWFERGQEYESQERYVDAEVAYRRAIAESSDSSAAAWFNLGNVLRVVGQQADAEAAFNNAIQHDPSMAVAYFNLADLQDERGDLVAASASLLAALRADRTLADAHFNLADCYERLGRRADAAKHWRAYLRFDQTSEWASVAKEKLACANA